MMGAGKLTQAAASAFVGAVQWGGRQLDWLGERIAGAGDGSMAAANRAGTMGGPTPGVGSSTPNFVVLIPNANNQLRPPVPPMLEANIVDSPVRALPSGEPKQLGPGGSSGGDI